MEVYGLTGGIGSGKSTVAAMLEEYGIPVVSADELSRMVVAPGSPGLADVVEVFGPEVLDEHGELDRKKMGRIVFTTTEKRRQLEAILHPRIRERYEQVLDALEKAGHPVMVYEVPLLFEKKLDQQDEMKAVILVTATADTRIARVKDRDSLTTDEVLARMRAQIPEHEKRERADYIIHNDGDVDDLRREVEYLVSRFLRIPPRADLREASIDEVIEEIEPELELDESEIDTLSPEEVIEEPTAPLETEPAAAPGQAPRGWVEAAQAQPPAQARPPVQGPPSMQAQPGAPTPVQTQPTTRLRAKPAIETPELEVELQPAAARGSARPKSSTSGASWIPAGPTPAPGPALDPAPVPVAQAQPSAPVPPAVSSAPHAAPPAAPSPPKATAPEPGGQPGAGKRGPRQRMGTMPQLSAPEITQALGKELSERQGGEESST
ncbi:Dephospho-CoA kinase [Enhygromyxa salina]|uniref:Dephospho-CoA kinase n=1 Tax=Enhygromyxa salina TaxID=215803 RepID=A0A2S9YG50_9BACT|nr:dephospho-CoA kinase [Enhygromyxa salina]PRQ04032.1 Dephospho-CoA kinase [Enhygromyxa salina]